MSIRAQVSPEADTGRASRGRSGGDGSACPGASRGCSGSRGASQCRCRRHRRASAHPAPSREMACRSGQGRHDRLFGRGDHHKIGGDNGGSGRPAGVHRLCLRPSDDRDRHAGRPPLFASLAIDDPAFGTTSFPIVAAWRFRQIPVELHLYGAGRRGFGAGRPNQTNSLLSEQLVTWLAMLGFVPPPAMSGQPG